MLEFLAVLLVLFLLFVAMLVWVGVRVARRVIRTVRGVAAGFPAMGPLMNAMPDPRWAQLNQHLDRRQREQARVARERIRAFLSEGGSGSLGTEDAQLLISCEKRVPELIDACLDRCRGARPDERCDYAVGTLERLVRIGEEAEAARSAVRARDDHRLATMHRYFDTVATRDPR